MDASKIVLGSALIQLDGDKSEKVIAFASKALSSMEERYANIERDMLELGSGILSRMVPYLRVRVDIRD